MSPNPKIAEKILVSSKDTVEKVRPVEPIELIIDDTVYDISDFWKAHPGGRIIRFYANQNATEAFHEFHRIQEPRVSKILKSLPSRPCDTETDPMLLDFRRFTEDLEKEFDLFKPSYSHAVYRLLEPIILAMVSFYFLCNGWFYLPGLLFGLSQGKSGFLQHECGHYSLTKIQKVDYLLQSGIYGLGCGMSGWLWRNLHNRHHATPQHHGKDPDLQTLPLIAFNEIVFSNSKNMSSFTKQWLSLQAFTFIPVSCLLVTLQWQLYLHPERAFRNGAYWDCFFMALRYVLLLCIPVSWSTLLGFFLLSDLIGGIYIFTSFSVSHTHLPVVKKNETSNWIDYACKSTTDINAHWFTNWYMSYLNFQVEHHLFPQAPQFKHALIQPRVREFFLKHGRKMDERPFFETLWATLKNMHEVGQKAHS